MTKLIKILG